MAFPLDPNGERCELSDPKGPLTVGIWCLPGSLPPGPTVHLPSHWQGGSATMHKLSEAGLSRGCSGSPERSWPWGELFFDTPWVCTHPWSHCLSTPDTAEERGAPGLAPGLRPLDQQDLGSIAYASPSFTLTVRTSVRVGALVPLHFHPPPRVHTPPLLLFQHILPE